MDQRETPPGSGDQTRPDGDLGAGDGSVQGDATTGSDFRVASVPYACRCGALVYWVATPDGLAIVELDNDGALHRDRCPLRGTRKPLTPRDRALLRAERPVRETPVQVTVTAETDPALMARITDALTNLGLAVDETRELGRQVARYAAQTRASNRPRGPVDGPHPPVQTAGETAMRGVSVVRHRGGAEAQP